MSRAAAPAVLVLLAALGAACSGLDPIGDKRPALPPDERGAVRAQVDRAIEQGVFNAAWNQEIAAGADRQRLERIATSALRARSRHAPSMFDLLRDRWGALGPDARAEVDAIVQEARDTGAWLRAAQAEIAAADDPPEYGKAWEVYRAAPAQIAPGLLEEVTDAREERAESSD
jgi:hypothetical protein